MEGSLRDDEYFVIEALCASCNGTWHPGEDPPDAYIMIDGSEVAVEMSTLTQHVICESGELVPRLSQDSGVFRLCDEVNEELIHVIPPGTYVLLTIAAPVKKIRKLKAALIDRITSIIQMGARSNEVCGIHGNDVGILIISGNRPSGKKVVGEVANRKSSLNILVNVQCILNNRIAEKARKCSKVQHRPLWLALRNDYPLADTASCDLAMRNLSITHPFGKICLVSGNKEIYTLYEA